MSRLTPQPSTNPDAQSTRADSPRGSSPGAAPGPDSRHATRKEGGHTIEGEDMEKDMTGTSLEELLAQARQEASAAAASLARLRRRLTEAQALVPGHQARFAVLRMDACAQQLAAQQLELGVLRLATRATQEAQQGQSGGAL